MEPLLQYIWFHFVLNVKKKQKKNNSEKRRVKIYDFDIDTIWCSLCVHCMKKALTN